MQNLVALFASVNAVGRLGRAAQGGAGPAPGPGPTPPPPPPAGPGATTFDSQYAGGFALNNNTTFFSRPAQTRPTTKSANLSSPAYTDANFGTMIFQVTDTSDTADSITHLRNDYSKRMMWNSDGTYFIACASNGYWHLYNAATLAHINATGGTNGRLPGLAGLDCEPTWHPTNPNKLWYTADFGGLSWFELDIPSGVSTTLFTFSGRLPSGFSTATRFSFGGEGRPSNDGRYWTFMATNSGFGGVGLMTYDRQTDSILSSVATSNKPNWVGTSQDGSYAIIGWHNFSGGAGYANWADLQAQGTNTADGTRAYPINGLAGSTWQQLDATGEHGDMAVDKLGNQVWVSSSYSPRNDVGDGTVYYRRCDNGTAYVFSSPNLSVYNGVDSAMHFSGTNFDRPGWAVITYEAGGTPTVWKDGCILLVELTPTSPRVLRVAHHQSNASTYFASPLAAPNRDLTQIFFGSDFRGGGTPYEQYMVGLPSWAVPA